MTSRELDRILSSTPYDAYFDSCIAFGSALYPYLFEHLKPIWVDCGIDITPWYERSESRDTERLIPQRGCVAVLDPRSIDKY